MVYSFHGWKYWFGILNRTLYRFHVESQPTSGNVFVNVDADLDLSLLDREKQDELYLTFEAVDGGGLRTSVQLVITLMDVNDNAPQISRTQYEGYVLENEMDLERELIIEVRGNKFLY